MKFKLFYKDKITKERLYKIPQIKLPEYYKTLLSIL